MNGLFQCGIDGYIMMRRNSANTVITMNPEIVNILKGIAYLIIGILGIALLFAWALKRFGSPKK